MNSEQRRAARRKRREEKRAQAKAERVKACTLETVADLNSLCKASKQAARGVMWKASTQRYMKDYLRNAVLSRRDLLEGRDICRGFIRFDLWERRKLKKMARMVADGIMTPEQVEQSYQSWRGGMKRLDAHRSVRAMDALYRSLFGNPAGGGCSMQSKPGGDTDGNMPLP